MSKTVVMRLFKPRMVPDLLLCQWLMLAFGKVPTAPSVQLDSNIRSSFAEKLIKATKGEKGIIEPTYIYLDGVDGGSEIKSKTGLDYFSVPVELGVCCPPFLIVAID